LTATHTVNAACGKCDSLHLLTPPTTHRIIQNNHPTLNRPALHADIDGVSLLVLVALHLLTLLKSSGHAAAAVGAGVGGANASVPALARLLTPAPGVGGLHWSVMGIAAAALAHAALLTSSGFMRWWVLRRRVNRWLQVAGGTQPAATHTRRYRAPS
jgi:hypothetical protein